MNLQCTGAAYESILDIDAGEADLAGQEPRRIPLAVRCCRGHAATDQPITIASGERTLHGELRVPGQRPARAFALLLHKAAGDRTACAQMAQTLASDGIASLRIDLRGHGESTKPGSFDPDVSRYFDPNDPAVVANFQLIRDGDQDVVSALRWIDKEPALSDLPLVMGSAYTGEEMAEAGAEIGYADVYVAMSPGNFSEASIGAIDKSGVPWLFLRAAIELPFFPALFEAIRAGSDAAEICVLSGEGHATDLFEHNPDPAPCLLQWINGQFRRPD